ncbi:S24/S26 family peptidase [Mycetocola spongiae]|uniref:hypothetical protein n=1 Tax=Mycetocola spongiae TaxID=2859226 RepID=UPI001CF29D6F|nr:hypothetical protein [Mycetocola spongiae]UCR88877.1 hypothetical protein KXZ72_13150 [Mycetocola spongiae]
MISRSARVAGTAGNILLNIAAVGGAICIVLAGLAFFFNITLIMFKTGSMSPGIPAGSVAVVREIPASEIAVGDVVTVDRAGALPITHRVTSITPGGNAAERSITMRGDANAQDDPAPYLVSTVRIMLASVPGLAAVLVWLGQAPVIGGITLAATALVTWAFWPRAASPRPRGGGRGEVAEGEPPRGRHAAPAGRALVLVLIAGCAAGLGLLPAPAARAAPAGPTEQVIRGRALTLISIGDPALMSTMVPGRTELWQVGVEMSAQILPPVEISVSATGDDALGLMTSISRCATRWVGTTCAEGETRIGEPGPARVDGITRQIAELRDHTPAWFLVSAWLAPGPRGGHEGGVELRLSAAGMGEDGGESEVIAAPGTRLGALPRAGSDLTAPLAAAVGVILLGAAVARLAGEGQS